VKRIVTARRPGRQGEKIESQRGTGVTCVTQITYTRSVILCRLYLINQQSNALRRMRTIILACAGAVLLFFRDRRDETDAGVVPWACCICRLHICLDSRDFAESPSLRVPVSQHRRKHQLSVGRDRRAPSLHVYC